MKDFLFWALSWAFIVGVIVFLNFAVHEAKDIIKRRSLKRHE